MIHSMCPECKHEVLPEHLSTETNEQTTDRYDSTAEMDYLSIEELMASKFHCRRCGHRECSSQEVSMSGTGISKIFDIDYHHYLFVSCTRCGFVEVFNPDVLRGHQSGVLGTVLDLIWG
ncbi:zinc ribbon domain-containing protein [Paenibacillus sp. CR_12]